MRDACRAAPSQLEVAAIVGKRRRNGMKSHLNPLKINTSSSTIELGLIQSVSITIDNIKGK